MYVFHDMSNAENTKWKTETQLEKLTHAYNCTSDSTTGYSSYHVLFGHKPKLPIDIIFGNRITENTKTIHKQYIAKYQEVMKEDYELAVLRFKNRKMKNKVRRDRHACLRPLYPGDRALIRNLSEREGTGKIKSYWKKGSWGNCGDQRKRRFSLCC